jgi:hypothetical protein
MFSVRSLAVWFAAVGLILGLTDLADAAKGAKGKKKAAVLKGLVKEVQTDKDKKDYGTLTVQTKAKKSKTGTPAPTATAKKITINADTKIEKLEKGAKKQKGVPLTGQTAKLGDIPSGSNIVVTLKSGSEDVAEKVQFVVAKKAKKKKANSQE